MKKLFIYIFAALTLLGSIPTADAAFENDITAQCAVLIDAQSRQVLYEKNPDEQMLIASTTKIMTALVVLENCELDEIVEIKPEYAGIEGSSIYLEAGEEITVRELLYGLLMESGNDAATALACYTAGSIDAFAELMNSKASELGCGNSHFVNPHGLDADGHYSCAYDLAIITADAMENQIFAEIVSTKTAHVGSRDFTNHNKLLWNYDGAIGVKTGYTMSAGRILVSCAVNDGMKLICVTISAPDDWNDHTKLYDWAFEEYDSVTISEQTTAGISVPVISGKTDSVGVVPAYSQKLTVESGSKIELKYEIPKFVYAPVASGDKAGNMTVICDGEELCTFELVFDAESGVDENEKLTKWEKIKRSWYLANKYGGYPYVYYTF